MRILVTGAAGFIGTHLCERLSRLGHTVRGVDNFSDYYLPEMKHANARDLAGLGVVVEAQDLATDVLGPLVADQDAIFHLAAQPGLSAAGFETYEHNNVVATHRLVEATLRAGGSPLLVNIGTSSVYGADATGDETSEPRPTSYYGVTKLAAEQMVLAAVRSRGLRACSFRLYSVYGPRERPDKLFPKLIHAILSDRPFPLFDGSERHERSFTYVDDVVRGLTLALNHPDACIGQVYNLGNDVSITTGRAIAIVEAVLGRPARIDRQPRRAGDQDRTRANIAKARRVLGYDPQTSPEHGLAQTVAWFGDNLKSLGEHTNRVRPAANLTPPARHATIGPKQR